VILCLAFPGVVPAMIANYREAIEPGNLGLGAFPQTTQVDYVRETAGMHTSHKVAHT